MFDALLKCTADSESEIASEAQRTSFRLQTLVANTPQEIAFQPFIQTFLSELQPSFSRDQEITSNAGNRLSSPTSGQRHHRTKANNIESKVLCLRWLLMLHQKNASECNKSLPLLLPELLRTLSDRNHEVVSLSLKVLAQVSVDKNVFTDVVEALTQLFLADRELLESRGNNPLFCPHTLLFSFAF